MTNENEGESLLDAVNAAIPSEEPTEEVENEEPAEEVENEEEAPEGDAEPEGEGDADAEEEAGEEEAEEGEEKPAAKKGAAAEKEGDPLNDPIPKGTLIPTQKRIEKLIGIVKERDTELVALRDAASQRDELIGEITAAGMNGDTYSIMLEYARGVNSGDPVGMQRSYDILMHELTGLAKALGHPLPGQDPLEGHADLIDAVKNQKIDAKLAIETAVSRNRAAATQRLQQAHATRSQTTAQQTQAQVQGKQALTTLGRQLAAQDGAAEYRRKAGLVVAMLQQTLPNLPPNQWARAFKAAYDQVPKAAPAPKAGTGKVPGAKKPQPLRGNKVPSGSSAKAPKNLMEAIGPAFE